MISSEIVDEMTINARFTLAVTCLEIVCEAWEIRGEKLDELLVEFWAYTELNRLDDWDATTQLLMPYEIEHLDRLANFERIDQEKRQIFHELLFDVWDVGRGNLYAGYQSINSREPLQNIVKMLEKNQIGLPELEPFLKLKIRGRNYWGAKFTKEDFKSGRVDPETCWFDWLLKEQKLWRK